MNNDEEMALELQKSNQAALDYLYNLLYKRLLLFSWRILHDADMAEDIVSESFVKLWDNRKTLSNINVIKGWMYTTVRNGCLTILDKERTRKKKEGLVEEEIIVDSQEHAVIKAELYAEVCEPAIAMIDRLPQECMRIFIMLYKQGKSVREISGELGISISTVKNQRARGLEILRKLLAKKEVVIKKEYVKKEKEVGQREARMISLKQNRVSEWDNIYQTYREHFFATVKNRIGSHDLNDIIFDAIEDVRKRRMGFTRITDIRDAIIASVYSLAKTR